MKTILIATLLWSCLFANAASVANKRILENATAKVTLERIERPEAEPVSRPFEIKVSVDCKTSKRILAQKNIPVCDTDLQDSKDVKITDTHIQFFHYEWDSKKSSLDRQGFNHCLKNKKIMVSWALSEFCVAKK